MFREINPLLIKSARRRSYNAMRYSKNYYCWLRDIFHSNTENLISPGISECVRGIIVYAYRNGIRTEILLENGNPLSRGCHWLRLEINCGPYGEADRRRLSSKEFFL